MSKVEGFAAIPNWMVRDQHVPGRNVLVYASLASRSGLGGIYPSQQTIAEETQLSERTVRTALRELEDLGVIERITRRATKRGRSTGLPTSYKLVPNGRIDLDEEPAIIAGRSEGPANASDATGKFAQVVPLIEVEPVEVEPAKPGFAEFYMAYPRKVGKDAARRAFDKAAKSTDPQVIVDAARAYASSSDLPKDKTFIPHPSRWLNDGRYADDEITAAELEVDEYARQRDQWLASRGVTLDEYLRHRDEPGWVESLDRRLAR